MPRNSYTLSYDHARSLLAFDERLRSPILASYQRCMAGTQCSRASVLVPLFAVYGLVHAVDAVFPVDSFFPDHQHQNLRAAEHPTHALHTGVVVHHPLMGCWFTLLWLPFIPMGFGGLRCRPGNSLTLQCVLYLVALLPYIAMLPFLIFVLRDFNR